MLVGNRNRTVSSEQRRTRDHFKQHNRGRIDIRTTVDDLTFGLLGREVLRGADNGARVICGIFNRLGDSKITDFDKSGLGDHDIPRLDIAVNDACAM